MLLLTVVPVMERVLVRFILMVLTALEMSPDLLSVLMPIVTLVPTLRMLEFNAELSVRITFKFSWLPTQQHLLLLYVVLCNNSDIRLAGGSDQYEGRVEICFNETWGTICDGSWSTNDANVACRQLGYAATGMQIA